MENNEQEIPKITKSANWNLLIKNGRISTWLLIIVTGILGGMGKIEQSELPYLLGFIQLLAIGGESAIEYLAQRFHFSNNNSVSP